jgi:hypothetical protein
MSPRPYRIDPRAAHERAKKAADARNSPDHHIARLADLADDLTDDQARRLVAILDLRRRAAHATTTTDDEDLGGVA